MSYLDILEEKHVTTVWERDLSGNLVKKIYDNKDYQYLFIPANGNSDTIFRDMHGNPVKKVMFEKKWDMREYAKDHPVLESDLSIPYRILLDHYTDCEVNAPYNILYYDIEIDFDLSEGKGYPLPENPFGEINSISCFDELYQKYIMFIPDCHKGTIELNDEEFGLEIVWCRNERDMLKEFCDYIDHIDILTAWNGNAFDLNYIMERLIINFGDRAYSMLCRDGHRAIRKDFVNKHKEEAWEWKLFGRIHLDMMELFKKFRPGDAKSFSLAAVCEREIGETKIEFEDDLGSLYRTDPQTFYMYSLHDSRLIKRLDSKRSIIALAMMMSREMCALPSDVTGSVKIIEMAIIEHCRNKGNIVVPDKIQSSKGEKYAGAVVYDSIQGRHENVFSADLVSLYPNTMILLGFSVETMLFQCTGGYEDYVHIISRKDSVGPITFYDVQTHDQYDMLPSEIDDLIRESGFVISAAGTIFNGQMGIIAEWLADNFALRVKYKDMMKYYESIGDEENARRYDLYQQVKKTTLNSTYGAAGNEHFRFYDIRLAESVTLSAQIISKHQAATTNYAIEALIE